MRRWVGTLILCIFVLLGGINLGRSTAPDPHLETGDTISVAEYSSLLGRLEDANQRADSWRGRFEGLSNAPEAPPVIVEVPVLVPDTVYSFVKLEGPRAEIGELVVLDSDSIAQSRTRTVDLLKCDDWSIYAGRILCDRPALGTPALFVSGGLAFDSAWSAAGELGVSWKPYRRSKWELRSSLGVDGVWRSYVTRYFGG